MSNDERIAALEAENARLRKMLVLMEKVVEVGALTVAAISHDPRAGLESR